MDFKYDPAADALRITLGKGTYKESMEVADGVIVDRTDQGDVIAVEILNASEKNEARSPRRQTGPPLPKRYVPRA